MLTIAASSPIILHGVTKPNRHKATENVVPAEPEHAVLNQPYTSPKPLIQGGSNMTGTNCDLFTQNQSRSYLNHLVISGTKYSTNRKVQKQQYIYSENLSSHYPFISSGFRGFLYQQPAINSYKLQFFAILVTCLSNLIRP
jgi:hypothetical protein